MAGLNRTTRRNNDMVRGDIPAVREQPFRVAVVVVTYNSADVLPGCLASLVGAARGVQLSEVVVADNMSGDGTAEVAQRDWDIPVRLLRTGRNGGYAAAINSAVESLAAEVDGIFVLNPDARPKSGSLAILARALKQPGRGIVYPRLLDSDGTLQPSLRRPPTVRRALAESLVGGSRAGRWGTLGELITDPAHYERPGPVAWGTGAAMLIAADAARTLGPWDESFLLYGEETEFSLRARDRGWEPWYEPAAEVEHIGGECGTNPVLWALLTVNRVRLFSRRSGKLASAGYFAAVTVGELIRAVAGRRTARAALVALLRPSRRLTALPG
ncbi:glycosyltransferase family 2 protein [Amycolatopsis jejuensis]|uniref:glycosyltransferase family 2 protein n=1 Tax=Amycolatopsis jejuensis TaxID=330084 RepID=UPI000AA72756|nr:glycosyltransferase family 2 protein [Amycolatopsis jejuensis]